MGRKVKQSLKQRLAKQRNETHGGDSGQTGGKAIIAVERFLGRTQPGKNQQHIGTR